MLDVVHRYALLVSNNETYASRNCQDGTTVSTSRPPGRDGGKGAGEGCGDGSAGSGMVGSG